ncbi:PepSY-associated TM helix domain-containing protein [Gilvimarinus polysaccharolyticus]|uniref:PepSY-associated TM helix domain-containing protein n=1 Tax=Gilvimarinus polysaccharolyticus TaxID=863921 RepID=UPI0006735062|nr:PepSY-associated TM helix domain-containing protein [Gilvimarinus polysaccharolyticus]
MKSPILLAVHRYIGLLAGIFFVITALTGALLIYKQPLLLAYYPALAAEQSASPAITADTVALLQQLDAQQAPAARRVRMPTADWPFFTVSYRDGSYQYLSTQGELLVSSEQQFDPLAFLMDLHIHWLAGHTGERISGYVHIAVLLLLATGIYAWWPRRWRKALTLALSGSVIKVAYSWHRTLGALSSLVLIVSVATGVIMVFYAEVGTALVASLGGDIKPIERTVEVTDKPQPWPVLYQVMRDTLPEGQLRSVSFSAEPGRAISVRKRMPGEWHQHGRSFVYINPYTAEAYAQKDAREAGLGVALMEKVYPLHSAAVGGPLYWVALTIASGMALLLFISGLYIWLWRRRARKS